MRILDLKNRKINYDNIEKYGFKKEHNKYIYENIILDESFKIIVIVQDGRISSKLIELEFGDEYLMADVKDFNNYIKEKYENILDDIIDKCTTKDIYKSKQTMGAIKYIKDKYGDDIEFLWEKFDDNGIWRNKLNDKWYGALMTISESKLGIDSDNIVEILDLRYAKDDIDNVIDNKKIFPGWHMNKKSWITIKLDDTLSLDEIYGLIDNSYNLSIDGKRIDELSKKVYEYILTIPKDKVVTYKQVAMYLGNKGLARIVGTILKKCNDSKYPCYKVLNSKGELNNEVFGNTQKELLEKDGIEIINNKVDLNLYQWHN